MQLLRNRLVATARTSLRKNASLGQLYGNMQEAYHKIQTPLMCQQPSQVCLQLRLLLTILKVNMIVILEFLDEIKLCSFAERN